VLLESHFLAALQVLLYAGAVLVLFLMIIMLIRLDQEQLMKVKPKPGKALGGCRSPGSDPRADRCGPLSGQPVLSKRPVSSSRESSRSGSPAFLLELGDRRVDLNVAPQKNLFPKATRSSSRDRL